MIERGVLLTEGNIGFAGRLHAVMCCKLGHCVHLSGAPCFFVFRCVNTGETDVSVSVVAQFTVAQGITIIVLSLA